MSPSKDFSGFLSCISAFEESELLFGTIRTWWWWGVWRVCGPNLPPPASLTQPLSFFLFGFLLLDLFCLRNITLLDLL